MSDYYDRAGNPMSMMDWARSYEKPNRRVDYYEDERIRISTIWLGLNHRYGDGPPLIFETMVFEGDSLADKYCWRWTTEEQAKKGHEIVVNCYHENLDPEKAIERFLNDDPQIS